MFPIEAAVPVRYPPFVTWGLIAVNALVFLYQISLPPQMLEAFIYRYALVPARYAHPEWAAWIGLPPGDYLPFLTNMFLHGGWLHVISNMWTLYIFGPAIEDRLGKGRFLVFYLVCGIGASVAHLAANADSAIPALGASGAIAGVIGAYMRLFPLARVIVLIPILFLPYFIELPAAIFAGLWFVLQLIQGVGEFFAPSSGGGVAWWAHVGGFVFGWLIIRMIHRSARTYRPFQRDEGVLGFNPTGHGG
ncbi:MAG: rhomboid family intramembrane serine protease [Alphaproteobacteria bacterium]|nr:MAG: rhomboid family intramembrane serine protease [Alphaproteobacteria bacterium]